MENCVKVEVGRFVDDYEGNNINESDLKVGAVIELDKGRDDLVELFFNDKLVAKGKLIDVDGANRCVRIEESFYESHIQSI